MHLERPGGLFKSWNQPPSLPHSPLFGKHLTHTHTHTLETLWLRSGQKLPEQKFFWKLYSVIYFFEILFGRLITFISVRRVMRPLCLLPLPCKINITSGFLQIMNEFPLPSLQRLQHYLLLSVSFYFTGATIVSNKYKKINLWSLPTPAVILSGGRCLLVYQSNTWLQNETVGYFPHFSLFISTSSCVGALCLSQKVDVTGQ